MPHKIKTFRWAVVLSLLAAVLVAAGCGGGGSSGNARDILDKAFKAPISSANVGIQAQARLQGLAALQGPATLSVNGPYQSNGKGKIASLNWKITASAGGRSFNAAFISTGDNAWVGFQGQNYEIGKAALAKVGQQQGQKRSLKDFGIDPQNWVTNPSVKDDQTVNGVDCKHVAGGLDVGKVLNDFNTAIQKAQALRGGSTTGAQITPAQIAQVKKYVKNPKFDVYAGKSDNKVRRIALSIDFQVPQGQQQKANGLQGGTITLRVDFSNVGQRQTITAPANAKPLKDLQNQIGALSGGTLGQ